MYWEGHGFDIDTMKRLVIIFDAAHLKKLQQTILLTIYRRGKKNLKMFTCPANKNT